MSPYPLLALSFRYPRRRFARVKIGKIIIAARNRHQLAASFPHISESNSTATPIVWSIDLHAIKSAVLVLNNAPGHHGFERTGRQIGVENGRHAHLITVRRFGPPAARVCRA